MTNQHSWDLEDGYCHTHRAYCSMANATPPDLGNETAREGVDRCDCGCKYWENDRCIDCGTQHASERSEGTRLYELRRSNAAGKHGDRRTKRARDRASIRRYAIAESVAS